MSSTIERARQYAERHGIPRAYEALEAILADPAVDVVYISTTNDRHKEQTLVAARASILKHGIYHQRKGLGVDESVMWLEYFLPCLVHEYYRRTRRML